MKNVFWRNRWWILAAAIAIVAGAAWIARQSLEQERGLFETDARIMHRLLSQRVVQHDAILATLTLLQPAVQVPGTAPAERRLPALYPHIVSVRRRDKQDHWNDPALQAAEAVSRGQHRAALATVDFASGQYQLVLAAEPTSFALTVDLKTMIPWDEWPVQPESRTLLVALEHAGQRFQIQGDNNLLSTEAPIWRFDFHKHLAAASQPFDVVVQQRLNASSLPWWPMLAWAVTVSAMLAAVAQLLRQRAERRRAEELVRLGQVARLNTLGELAAGMAHELNQPLTAVLANTQAAQRLLADDPPDRERARDAMVQAAAQARRAADVVGRLRDVVERPDAGATLQSVQLNAVAQRALYLLEPECRRRKVEPVLHGDSAIAVQANPVALEQIVHNLLMNAMQALESVSNRARTIIIRVQALDQMGQLVVSDNGPGIAPDLLPRVFEPFFSTRTGGLGLGLSLCETLANAMGGELTATNTTQGGASFMVSLPLAAQR